MQGDKSNSRVAVLGLGVTGIAAVKNLLEAGLQVEAFDQNEHIGGLWQWSPDVNVTTVLKTTRANVGKRRNCYQDLPFPEDVPNYPFATDIVQYLKDYVAKFDLEPHFRLGWRVTRVERSSDDRFWNLTFVDTEGKVQSKQFDKVIVATGPYNAPFIPDFAVHGSEKFQGTIMHAQAYKNAQDYRGKKIVVVGLSNTGGDTAVDLAPIASQVYVSHRAGARIILRSKENEPPLEARITRRALKAGLFFLRCSPWLSGKATAMAVERKMRKSHPAYQESWHLLPAPPVANANPVMNDFILSRLADGSVISKPGITRLVGPSTVEFADGSAVDGVDVIICATGYQADYSIFAPEADPTAFDATKWDQSPHSNGLKYPRLYQGMLSTRYPESLAHIGPYRGHSLAIFDNADLSTAAIAQIFAGNFLPPSKEEMESWCDANYAHNCKRISHWRIAKPECNPVELERWLNSACGNGVNENLGWGWQGWKFWWTEFRLYYMLVDGITTPHTYRLFEGRGEGASRKRWEGARAAIEKANQKER